MNTQKEAIALKNIYNRAKHEIGLDYGKVAEYMGLGEHNRSQVSHMLNGINPINLVRALQFCEILEITLDEFSPRLAREADEVARRVVGKVKKPIDGNVKFLIGMDTLTIKKILLGKRSSDETVYWPGEHGENTYMVSVEGSACDPELSRGSIAVIDADRKPLPGKLFAFIDGTLRFAKFNGDGYAEFVNPDYPNRIFKMTKKMKTIGLVIGSQTIL
jgi:hypothetical protein|tara:strand:- start:353 stop:1003 length:651 start_codon:yes stop_codon:yes gene_type:complete